MYETLNLQIDVESKDFLANFEQMTQLCEELQSHVTASQTSGSEKSKEKHKTQGKLLARERVDILLDPGSAFLELMPLAGKETGVPPGAGILCGIGQVSGQACMVVANIPTIKGGAINATALLKMQRAAKIALENRLPLVYLVESAGADLLNQADIYNYGGAEFRSIIQRSKLNIPTISVVFGSSTAGGAYIPGMSDYVIMIKNQAKVYLAGPPLVKMAINEVTDDETLGGAQMHATESGVADYLAEDETEGLRIAREIVYSFEHLTPSKFQPKPVKAPKYSNEKLLGMVQVDLKRSMNMHGIIACLVDGSQFHEFKPRYGSTLITGFADVMGYPVGIVANNGILFSESAKKGAQFIQLCNKQNRPLLFLQNTTGFMVGNEEEKKGIIKNGAHLINAVSNSEVPAITIMTGASYGAGNYGMCGLAFEPRFLFSWPNSKIAVMGPEQLSGVMKMVSRGQDDETTQKLVEKVRKESTAEYATSRVWDDGIIDPRDTRDVLGVCLHTIFRNPIRGTEGYGTFRF